VYSAGDGVHDFTLDPSIGEFVLTEERIVVPERGNIFSVNEGNWCWWDDRMRAFLTDLKGRNLVAEKPYTGRYVGSLVADFDRTLRKGGIFMYPTDSKRPKGRLRLLYECLPLAFIMEHSGGFAINGRERLINVTPTNIHERSAFIAGSPTEMKWFARAVYDYDL
jgi:fructose-1,6-bisphosphatase I